jgi:hypothetical protein
MLGGTFNFIKMPDVNSVLDVTFEELSTDHQLILKEAMDQFQYKCLLCFSKNRSGTPFLKSEMPRVLMPGESDITTAAEKEEAHEVIQRSMEATLTKHNTALLIMLKQMMIAVFGPGMEKMLKRASPQETNGETGDSSATAPGQPILGAGAQSPQQSMGSQPIQHQNPYQAMPNPPTYGEMAFDTSGFPQGSTYRIAPASNRLQKNMYTGGYSEYMDYGTIDALPNPGYGAARGMAAGRPGNQDANVDLLVQRMTEVLQNQFGLKPKNQGHVYTSAFPEWYYRVALPNRVKPPTEFTKFSGQDDTSTVEHIARYLM